MDQSAGSTCATTLRGQLGFDAKQFKDCESFNEILKALLAKSNAIYEHLSKAPDEQIGRLACSMDATQVRNLATNAVIHSMAERIWRELNQDDFLKCRHCFFTVSKRTPGSFNVMRDHIDERHSHVAEEIATVIHGSLDDRERDCDRRLFEMFLFTNL